MKIRIKQYSFDLREPYVAGHTLTPDEAKALNGLRAENIRNVMSRNVERECATLSPGELLDSEMLQSLQAQISDYDARYTFRARHTPSRNGSLEAEIEAVAREEAEIAIRSGQAEDAREAIVAQLRQSPLVQEAARKRLATREQTFSNIGDL